MTDGYPSIDTEAEPALIARGYHERSKHHFERYAPYLGYMDWATQPDPFRRFEGAAELPLAMGDDDATPAYDQLYQPGSIPPQPVTAQSIGHFFYYSMHYCPVRSRIIAIGYDRHLPGVSRISL